MNGMPPRDAESFHKTLDYTVVETGGGVVRIELTGRDHLRNRVGSYIHGGVLVSLMDIAGIMAGNSGSDETRSAVTVNLNCNFLSAAMGKTVHAEARVTRKGRSMFFCDCRVVDATTGKLVANGQGIYKYL